MVERPLSMREVLGSIPNFSIFCAKFLLTKQKAARPWSRLAPSLAGGPAVASAKREGGVGTTGEGDNKSVLRMGIVATPPAGPRLHVDAAICNPAARS